MKNNTFDDYRKVINDIEKTLRVFDTVMFVGIGQGRYWADLTDGPTTWGIYGPDVSCTVFDKNTAIETMCKFAIRNAINKR